MRPKALRLVLVVIVGALAGCGSGAEIEFLFRGRTEAGEQFSIARKYDHVMVLGKRDVSKSLVLVTDALPAGLVTLAARDEVFGDEFQVRTQGHKVWLVGGETEAPVAAVDFESHSVHPASEDQPAWATPTAGRIVKDES